MANAYDRLNGREPGPSDPANYAEAVTPHDTNPLNFTSSYFWVGTGGNVTLRPEKANDDVVYKNVPSGSYLVVRATHVRATGTSAADLVLHP